MLFVVLVSTTMSLASPPAPASGGPISFRLDVMPVFMAAGCNTGSCHGSARGQDGFRLSLFGYDFHADHEELLKGDPPRVNIEKPLESQILVKPKLRQDLWVGLEP